MFSDTERADADQIVIPYTRQQYLALPRKKKKNVLMCVKKLVQYNATLRLYNALSSLKSENPRVAARLEYLKAKLAEDKKGLPVAKLWENAVKRVEK